MLPLSPEWPEASGERMHLYHSVSLIPTEGAEDYISEAFSWQLAPEARGVS